MGVEAGGGALLTGAVVVVGGGGGAEDAVVGLGCVWEVSVFIVTCGWKMGKVVWVGTGTLPLCVVVKTTGEDVGGAGIGMGRVCLGTEDDVTVGLGADDAGGLGAGAEDVVRAWVVATGVEVGVCVGVEVGVEEGI